MADAQQNIKVMTRVRPFNKREIGISQDKKELLRSCVKMMDKTVTIIEFYRDEKGFEHEREREAFQFDEAFWSMPMEQQISLQTFADQQYTYERSGYIAMKAALDGFNCTIFAYGQTGSGKTYSMLGCRDDPGISPKLVDDIFGTITEWKTSLPTTKVEIECMFFEIYNEKARDLFAKKLSKDDHQAPKIRQHPTKGVYVEGLTRKVVEDAEKTKHFIEKGTAERALAETKMNSTSSRSHAIFQIQITVSDAMKGTQKISTLNLVDLAGSEKIKMTGATGSVLTEAKSINQSLSALRKVIDVLIENSEKKNKKNHKVPPFRESVLTYVLSDSLGGNSKTQMIATISPHESNIEDTIGTLRYALRAKAIVCHAKVNEEKSAKMMDAMKDEIMALQLKLKTGGGGGGGGGEPSEEIKREIALREEEVKKMETTQVALQTALDEAAEKEAEMQRQLEDVQQQRMELDLAVSAQKRERFAAAFRNAFVIQVDKEKIEKTHEELETLKTENTFMKDKYDYLVSEVQSGSDKLREYEKIAKEREDKLKVSLAEKVKRIEDMEQTLATQQNIVDDMKQHAAQQDKKQEDLEAEKGDLQRRCQKLQADLLSAQAKVDREQAEKARMKLEFEDKLNKHVDEKENLRKRKDKYKALFMETMAKSEAKTTIIDSLQSDRQSFLTTLKAQQHMAEEQSTSVERLVHDKEIAENKLGELQTKLTRKDEDLRALTEALREYQNAAAEWMYENHAVGKELERVQSGYTELRGLVEKKFIMSPMAGGGASEGSPISQHSPVRSNRHVSPSHVRPRVEALSPNSRQRNSTPRRQQQQQWRNGASSSPGFN